MKAGNVLGVFHFCMAGFGCERCWHQIIQAAVRPFVVVVITPSRDLFPYIEGILEPTHLQALLAQPSGEALHIRVLHGLARLNMYHLDLAIEAPSWKMTTGQFRVSVTANRQ